MSQEFGRRGSGYSSGGGGSGFGSGGGSGGYGSGGRGSDFGSGMGSNSGGGGYGSGGTGGGSGFGSGGGGSAFGSGGGTGYGSGTGSGYGNDGSGMMGMNPLTNDQPLQFSSTGKAASMGSSGDQSNNEKGDSGTGDGNSYGNTNWQQSMMSAMGMGMMGGMYDANMQFAGFDPNMMGMMFPPPMPDMSQRETLYLKESTLFPPHPNSPAPTTKERPPGCRTIFVGGLPENANEAIMREVFERCGEITSYRQGRRNFCHIRFGQEMSVENALYFSGYRMQIGKGEDTKDTGRIVVDYATARDDQYDYECQQRRLAREMRHQQSLMQPQRPPSPPSVPMIHYTDHEAQVLTEQLKGEETFAKATSQLITWLERGDCNKRSSHSFYGLIQCVNSHVRRLMNEKQLADEELAQAKAYHQQRVTGTLMQFTLIEQVFNSASKQRAWDHFTKAQRKNLDLWRKQAKELKASQQEELGMAEKGEEDMDMSDNEDEKPRGKRERAEVITIDDGPDLKKIRLMAAENELVMIKEENQSMHCQIEAYKNEAEILKNEKDKYNEEKETQIKALQHALVGMQQQLMEAKAKLRKEEEAKEALEASSEAAKKAEPEASPVPSTPDAKKAESALDTSDIKPPGTESPTPPSVAVTPLPPLPMEPQFTQVTVNLKEREALLVGFMSTFLHVHPFGASVEYLWSYLQRLDPVTTSSEIDGLLNRFPKIFKQELFGVGATLEKRWKFIGFTSCLGKK